MNDKKIEDLPPSSDKEFWGEDADINIHEEVEVYKPNKGHSWRQQGPYIICNSCTLKHSVYIGVDKQLIANGKGMKVIKI